MCHCIDHIFTLGQVLQYGPNLPTLSFFIRFCSNYFQHVHDFSAFDLHTATWETLIAIGNDSIHRHRFDKEKNTVSVNASHYTNIFAKFSVILLYFRLTYNKYSTILN